MEALISDFVGGNSQHERKVFKYARLLEKGVNIKTNLKLFLNKISLNNQQRYDYEIFEAITVASSRVSSISIPTRIKSPLRIEEIKEVSTFTDAEWTRCMTARIRRRNLMKKIF